MSEPIPGQLPVPDQAAPDRTAAVAAAVDNLDAVGELAPKDQIPVYSEAHAVLADTLDTIDER